MIKIVENNSKNIIFKEYPAKQWLAFFFLTIFVILMDYQALFNTPIYSSLTCDRGWFKTVNCELAESSLFRQNSRHQIIKNIHEPKKILGNETIWLNTEIDLLHNKIINNYYPTNRFLEFSNVYLYRFHRQALQEVDQINNFIQNRNSISNLIIVRKIFPLFYILLLLLPLNIMIGIIVIAIQPIKKYTLDVRQRYLSIEETILGELEIEKYPLDKLKIVLVDEEKNSILLTTDSEMSYLIDDFQNKQEALDIFNTLKQYIT